MVVEESQMFELVLTASGAVSMANKQTVRVRARSEAWAFFPLRPLVVGEISIAIFVMSSQIQNSTMVNLSVLVCLQAQQRQYTVITFKHKTDDRVLLRSTTSNVGNDVGTGGL